MAKQLINSRSQVIRDYFSALMKQHPEWKPEEIEKKVASKFFLKPRTIKAVLKGEGIYAD